MRQGQQRGDGLVVARLLREAGREVTVVCVAPPEDFKGDAGANLSRLPGDPPVRLGETARSLDESLVVDALLGTGFAGEPRGAVAEAIDAVNAAGAPVVSVDVPSGVDASTGAVSGRAVSAAVTVTFHAAKPGLWIRPGKAHAGEVHTIDIGIPRGAPLSATTGLIAPSVLDALPRRGGDSTKFTSGHVLVAGGSRGLTGAPRMAAHASMRAGAGYVTACVPALAAGRARERRARRADDARAGRTRWRAGARGRGARARDHQGRAARSRSGRGSGAARGRSPSPAGSRATRRPRWCSTPTG